MASGDDDDVAGVADVEGREDGFVLFGVDGFGFGEAFRVGEGGAIVDDDGGEAGDVGDCGRGCGRCGRRRR